jgi:glycerate 2-kinase
MNMSDTIQRLIRAALNAVDPAQSVRNLVSRDQGRLSVAGMRYDLRQYDGVYVVGGGKAGAPMALALSEVLGADLTGGWINVKEGHLIDEPLPETLVIHEAGHPIPNEAGQEGARRILDLARQAGERDLVFCLISGGGSALLPAPVEGISLADLQALTGAMLRCGATINEINAVRKHCSQLKGGQLARVASPATVVSLILSDVVGNPLDVIASGPTVPDTTTFGDAYAVLDKFGIVDEVPQNIIARLRAGIAGDIPDTPKAGDPLFDKVQNVIVGSNAIAARAAAAAAREMEYNTLVLSTYVEGEAREIALVGAAIAKSLVAEGWPIARPACVIAGGETTVTIRGSGKGGRNQEMALAAAIALEGWQGITLFTLATDGTDGPTDAAGAIVDGQTLSRARALGLSAADYMARNDSYHFFDRLGDLIRTGPTNTNVNDLLFVLAP